jgi:IS1 family transposase
VRPLRSEEAAADASLPNLQGTFFPAQGDAAAVTTALQSSAVSKQINTAFVERQNGTDRKRNGRKVRKAYCFSKDWHRLQPWPPA